MTGVDAWNAALAVLAIVLGVLVGRIADVPASAARPAHGGARTTVLVDASGTTVTLREFRRIASGSILADRLLLELADADRILAFSRAGSQSEPWAYRLRGRAAIDPAGDVESILTLRPDLLVVNNFVDPNRVARLREAGVVVFDLGEMRGLVTLAEDIRQLAALTGHPERGESFLAHFLFRIHAIADDVPMHARPTAIYMGIHGTHLFGGARRTSFHDVLTYGGLRDIAADRYEGWPAYSNEQVLALDPDVLVTQTGRGALICGHAGFSALRACRTHRVVEVDPAFLNEPGISMLEAAESVRMAVHGPRRRPSP